MTTTEILIPIATTILGTLLGLYLSYKLWTHSFSHGVGARVFGPDEMKANVENGYYQVLEQSVAKAKSEILYFGEGFNMSEAEGKKDAQKYIQATREALEKTRALTVVRMQTVHNCDKRWRELLDELEVDSDRFHVHDIQNLPDDHIQTIILIDPLSEYSKVFYLICEETVVQKKRQRALTGVMIEGGKDLTIALKKRLNELCKKDLPT